MEIISYLKPIEIFNNIALINKLFNQNIKTMRVSFEYSNVFNRKHYSFLWDKENKTIYNGYFNKSLNNDSKLFQAWNSACSNCTHWNINTHKYNSNFKWYPTKPYNSKFLAIYDIKTLKSGNNVYVSCTDGTYLKHKMEVKIDYEKVYCIMKKIKQKQIIFICEINVI